VFPPKVRLCASRRCHQKGRRQKCKAKNEKQILRCAKDDKIGRAKDDKIGRAKDDEIGRAKDDKMVEGRRGQGCQAPSPDPDPRHRPESGSGYIPLN